MQNLPLITPKLIFLTKKMRQCEKTAKICGPVAPGHIQRSISIAIPKVSVKKGTKILKFLGCRRKWTAKKNGKLCIYFTRFAFLTQQLEFIVRNSYFWAQKLVFILLKNYIFHEEDAPMRNNCENIRPGSVRPYREVDFYCNSFGFGENGRRSTEILWVSMKMDGEQKKTGKPRIYCTKFVFWYKTSYLLHEIRSFGQKKKADIYYTKNCIFNKKDAPTLKSCEHIRPGSARPCREVDFYGNSSDFGDNGRQSNDIPEISAKINGKWTSKYWNYLCFGETGRQSNQNPNV